MTFDISKCKPFDLERALAGDKVATKDGREVIQVIYADKAVDYRLFVVYKNGDGDVYLESGKKYTLGESKLDLLMLPKEPVVTRKYFKKLYFPFSAISFSEFNPDLENWYMYIEYHDGEPVNAVFAKDVK